MKGKKYIIGMLGLTVAGALVLTGCGNNKNSEQKDEGKKLVCTLDMSSELSGLGNMSTSIEFDYDKDGKEIKKATLGIDVEITSEDVTDEMLEALEKILKKTVTMQQLSSIAVMLQETRKKFNIKQLEILKRWKIYLI